MADFPVVLRGYHRLQVDAFIARIEGTLGRHPLSAPPVTVAELIGVRFAMAMRGYLPRAVDERLEAYLRELEVREYGPPRRISAGEVARLTRLVRNARFATTRLAEGYDELEVDEFLERITVAQHERRASAADVLAARFRTTWLRAGYDQRDVDGFLDRLAAELRRG